jgi:hypothetical protein
MLIKGFENIEMQADTSLTHAIAEGEEMCCMFLASKSRRGCDGEMRLRGGAMGGVEGL